MSREGSNRQFLEVSSNWPDEGFSMRVVNEETVSRAFDMQDTGTLDGVSFFVLEVKAGIPVFRDIQVKRRAMRRFIDPTYPLAFISDLVIAGTDTKVGEVRWTDH